jgi:energy-coupling factor transport system permease protein
MGPTRAPERVTPPWLGHGGPTSWHSLDPLTRLTISVATLMAVIALGGVAGPLLLGLLAVLLPGALARVLADLLRTSLLLALPLALSAALVNLLFTPGGHEILVQLGPLSVTAAGVQVALETAVRVFVMAGAVTLYYLTTRPAELVASLHAHGTPARLTFVIHNAVAMIPRLAERATEVAEAQRARGLDSEGSLLRRLGGVTALAAPSVIGAIDEAETRAMALEMRGFSRPGRHTLLWAPTDTARQRAARWAMLAGILLLVTARAAGW